MRPIIQLSLSLLMLFSVAYAGPQAAGHTRLSEIECLVMGQQTLALESSFVPMPGTLRVGAIETAQLTKSVPEGRPRLWSRDRIIAVLQEAAKPESGLHLDVGTVISKAQRGQSELGTRLFQAYMAVTNSLRSTDPYFASWDDALSAAGLDPAQIRKPQFVKWTREAIIAVILEAANPESGVSLYASEVIAQRMKNDLAGRLFQAYTAVLHNKHRRGKQAFTSWNDALRAAFQNPTHNGNKRTVKWTEDTSMAVIADAVNSLEELYLDISNVISKAQRESSPRGLALYHAYNAGMNRKWSKRPPLPSWYDLADRVVDTAEVFRRVFQKRPMPPRLLTTNS